LLRFPQHREMPMTATKKNNLGRAARPWQKRGTRLPVSGKEEEQQDGFWLTPPDIKNKKREKRV